MTHEEELFFDRISVTWDDDEIMSTPDIINKLIGLSEVKPGMSVLDLGTGTGVLVPFLDAATHGSPIKAVDISHGMLDRARAKYGDMTNVTFVRDDFEKNVLKGRFDRIFLYCVYPHLHQPAETLRRLAEDNLTEDGAILIAFPSDENFVNSIHSERKAPSDLLPDAAGLAEKINKWGLTARVVSASTPYVVTVNL